MEKIVRKKMFPNEFIKDVLIKELGSMLPKENFSGYPYELFILISIGIEFLGACEDIHSWDEEKIGLNKKRFYGGLKLFPVKYYRYKEFLYKKLRCGMAHIFAPMVGLGLGEDKNNTLHLLGYVNENNEMMLDLNIQEFYNDFKSSCEKVIYKINKNEYNTDNKIYEPFLSMPL